MSEWLSFLRTAHQGRCREWAVEWVVVVPCDWSSKLT